MWQMFNSVTLDFACLLLSMMSFSLAMEKNYKSHLKSYSATVLIVYAKTGSTVLQFNIKSNLALLKMLLLKNASCCLPSLHLRYVYRSTPKVHFSGIEDSTVICFPIASSESEHAILSGGLRNSS